MTNIFLHKNTSMLLDSDNLLHC